MGFVGQFGNAVLLGSGEMFDAATLARPYPSGKAQYLNRFRTALDLSIRAGFDRFRPAGVPP
jgi:hypothetical protein